MADPKSKLPARRGRRKLSGTQSPEEALQATRSDILHAATLEFVAKGYDGASISSITQRTKTSQRMLYYHFGGKDELYRAVLEAGYARMFKGARPIEAEHDDPLQALKMFAEKTFDLHIENEDFVRLIMVENIAGAKTLEASKLAREPGNDNLADLHRIIQHGKNTGVFRKDVDAEDVYAVIAGLSFNAVSNRYTVNVLFGFDLEVESARNDRRSLIATAACRYAAA